MPAPPAKRDRGELTSHRRQWHRLFDLVRNQFRIAGGLVPTPAADREVAYNPAGRAGRAVAGARGNAARRRKVRTEQGTVVANGHRPRGPGKCHRKYTADGPGLPGNG